uniref:Uncharacterized protein n=1 Tax=viral metagenome TaxID=1070528 RepID=A0A6M3L688_9ZZZZ
MAIEQVTKKHTKGEFREVTVDYDFGDSFADMVNKFGEEVVYTSAKANMRVRCQAVIDGGIEKGLSDEEIQNRVTAWKPGVALETGAGYDPLAAFRRMSPEEKAAFLANISQIAESEE